MTDYKDQLESTANQILQGAIDAATKGGEFLKEQIPDLLKQLLAWNLYKDVFFIALVLLLSFAAYRISKWLIEKDEDSMFFIAILGGLGGFIAVFGFCNSVLDAIQILVAPKVWLLEYASALIRHR